MTTKGHPSFFTGLGPTGERPGKKISDDDEGELRFGVARIGDLVRIDFGKTPITWLAMPPSDAINFAKALLELAGVKYEIADQ